MGGLPHSKPSPNPKSFPGHFLTTFLLMGFEEKSLPPSPLLSVRSEVIVNAPPEKVWNNVVTFSRTPPADDWLFDLGIACPTCATIEGTGWVPFVTAISPPVPSSSQLPFGTNPMFLLLMSPNSQLL